MKESDGKRIPLIEEKYSFQLFVAGMSQKSMDAIDNVQRICRDFLQGKFELEIIDIYKHPEIAIQRQVICSPSLIKKAPLPKKLMIGDFSNREKMIKALGIVFKED